ncbi:quinon protein alcohol dehydrogenase-like superfamily [Geranomyces variabilis]|nr:quinon protein alcohol dehydrogenase-like superfamily [Geranomyces variabilis]
MEYRHTFGEGQSKPILCLQYNPIRREVYSGGEDTMIRVFDDTGKLVSTLCEHAGWITGLLYCAENKTLFSCAIDGMLIAWGANGRPVQKVETGTPLYSLAYNARRHQIMVGCSKEVRVFQLINLEDTPGSTDVMETRSVSCGEHTDLVSCIVSAEGRFYSAGFDRKLVIYDIPHHGNLKLRVSYVLPEAHDAAISCMIYGKDGENSWLITGSFDCSVKLWSLDGNLLQRFDGLNDTVTSLCYVPKTQTLWITANSHAPIVYDPKSGINVSDFVRTGEDVKHHTSGLTFKHLLYVPDVNETLGGAKVLGATNRKGIVVWKYNPTSALTILPGHTDVVECLTFTSKEPLLIFSGGDDGVIRKWERLQLNAFMYSKETLHIPREEKHDDEPTLYTFTRNPGERRKKQVALHKRVTNKLHNWERVEEDPAAGLVLTKQAQRQLQKKDREIDPGNKVLRHHRKKMAEFEHAQEGLRRRHVEDDKSALARPGVVSMLYYEPLDVLISGYTDSKIHIWGYNEEVVRFVPEDAGGVEKDLGDPASVRTDGVSNRVAGMSLKYTLEEHKDAVTGIACFMRDGVHWLLTTGFDRRVCIWEYTAFYNVFQKKDVFRNAQQGFGREELAADGIILDLEYCAERNEYAYASEDKQAYVRKFSPKGSEMYLQAVLQGHDAEVTQIKWCRKNHQWITGSEDRTIRVWPADGIPCLRVINNDGPVTAMCLDVLNGSIITGSRDKVIRVFDPDKKDEIAQTNVGHTDEVRRIIHIPARDQYVSASWDNTVRVWNAYTRKGQPKGSLKAAGIAPAAVPTGMVGVFDEEERPVGYSELNPLVKPALLSKPIFMPGVKIDTGIKETFDTFQEQARLDDELRTAITVLESSLLPEEKQPRAKTKPPLPSFRARGDSIKGGQ